jgi:hypothetical protein
LTGVDDGVRCDMRPQNYNAMRAQETKKV